MERVNAVPVLANGDDSGVDVDGYGVLLATAAVAALLEFECRDRADAGLMATGAHAAEDGIVECIE